MQRRSYTVLSFLCFGALIACGYQTTVPAQDEPGPNYLFLDHPGYIRRLAIDLMGVFPDPEDLNTPSENIPELIGRYMDTEEFYERILWLANDIFLTRNQRIEYFMESYNYEDENTRYDVIKAVDEEPLRLFEYIVRKDLPLTELVTADYTITNSTLAWFWNIDYPGPPGGSQWLPGRYRDGREHAGVLTQNSFYYRYNSTYSNKQRHRANNITRIFLDDDHLLRDVNLDLRRQANDPDLDLLDATRNNPGCLACHTTLDGIGAHLFAFSIGPAGESLYARQTFGNFSYQGMKRSQLQAGRQPSYYGYPSRGMRDLGQYIAADPRFARTMVKDIYRFLLHRDLDYRDRDLLNRYTEFFISHNWNTKALIREIVSSDEYRAIGVQTSEQAKHSKPVPPRFKVSTGDPTRVWKDFIHEVSESGIPAPTREAVLGMARVHAIETGFSLRRKQRFAKNPSGIPKDSTSYPDTIRPPSPEEIIQPFKLATPEQLHSLGKKLVGEVWDGYEGGQWLPEEFPHLLYNTDIKVAAGGYDGEDITTRRWSVPPTYLLVLERWGEVLAQDVIEKEIYEERSWHERKVFTLITGTENPEQAEPAIRDQIAEWLNRFYGETVDAWSPEVNDVYGVFLAARREALREHDDWLSTVVAWNQVLGMLLGDIRIAVY